jgi:hypothetical protein
MTSRRQVGLFPSDVDSSPPEPGPMRTGKLALSRPTTVLNQHFRWPRGFAVSMNWIERRGLEKALLRAKSVRVVTEIEPGASKMTYTQL